MSALIDTLLVLLLLTNLLVLGTSGLPSAIRIVAAQGVLLGCLALVGAAAEEGAPLHHWGMGLAGIGLKGLLFPWLMSRAVREVDVRREVEPLVGFVSSVLFGVAALVVSLWVASRLPVPHELESPLLVPAAFTTLLSGLFVIVSRRKALTQVLGYLVLENGVYALGVALIGAEPLIVELGVLLDLLVAVFVFGITIHHINRTFEREDDADVLATLRETAP